MESRRLFGLVLLFGLFLNLLVGCFCGGRFVFWVFVLIYNKSWVGFVLIDKVEVVIFASPA
jgi:hypothetical protein